MTGNNWDNPLGECGGKSGEDNSKPRASGEGETSGKAPWAKPLGQKGDQIKALRWEQTPLAVGTGERPAGQLEEQLGKEETPQRPDSSEPRQAAGASVYVPLSSLVRSYFCLLELFWPCMKNSWKEKQGAAWKMILFVLRRGCSD